MKIIKSNLKLIVGFIVGVILTGGLVYAATSAKDVDYTTEKNSEISTVEEALNDLYSKQSELETKKCASGSGVLDTTDVIEINNLDFKPDYIYFF